MGLNQHPWWEELTKEQLDLLHLEAEGALTSPQQQEQLKVMFDVPAIQAARRALQESVHQLSVRPEPPRSVAEAVLSDIQHARLMQVRPPCSLAEPVTQDIRFSQVLAVPAAPASVGSPAMPRSVADAVLNEMRLASEFDHLWHTHPTPVPPRSVRHAVLYQIQQDLAPKEPLPSPIAALHRLPPLAAPRSQRHNRAPLALVISLLLGLLLMAITEAWPNLAAGAVVVQTLLYQVSPWAGVGLALLFLTSLLITWRPAPAARPLGLAAYALSGALTIPALYNVAGGQGGLAIGRTVTIDRPVIGNVMAIGGDIQLKAGAQVSGEVITLLGDVRMEPEAQVSGRINALLGHAPRASEARQTPPPEGLALAAATAFRPVLGWLGAAAWPQLFVALTAGLLLLLFVARLAPALARRQRHAPMRTLALGVLLLFAVIIPAFTLALMGYLGPALIASALAALLIATGLSVSAYDLGRSLAYRVRLPVPDAVGALLGLSAFTVSLSWPLLSFALALIGGAWGAGTLLLTQRTENRS